MNEFEKAMVQVLYEVKHQVHDKAVDPGIKGVDPYVSIKKVDAIIMSHIKKYMESPKETGHESHK